VAINPSNMTYQRKQTVCSCMCVAAVVVMLNVPCLAGTQGCRNPQDCGNPLQLTTLLETTLILWH
jgi:hypothetical protein